jgi:hypothetical protein
MNKRVLAFFLALALLSALPPLAARADDPAALLAKHKAYVGWQFGDPAMNSLRLTGHSTTKKDGVDTVSATFTEDRLGIAWRRDSHSIVKNADSMTGFTGRIFWATNQNGFTRPQLGDVQKYLVARDLIFHEASTGFVGTDRGTKVIDGTSYDVVRISPDISYPIDLYIDPSSGAYKQAIIDPDGTYDTTINIDAYTDALPGKKLISQWRTDDSTDAHSQFDKVVANAVIDASQLHPPEQTAQWTFASDKPFPIQFVDNDTTYEHAIYIDAIINGVKGHFVMDTGASDIFLTQAFADRAHLKTVDNETAGGIGGSVSTRVQRADTFQVGDNVLTNVIVSSAKIPFDHFDGLIGFDLFAGAIVNVDLDKQQMTLYDPKTYQADNKNGFVLTVDLTNQIPSIPMKINGNTDVNAWLDSGNAGNIDVSSALVTRYGVRMLVDSSLIGSTTGHQAFSGVGGVEEDRCGRLGSVSVGPISYTEAPACESPSFEGKTILVGFDFLKNFNMIFNYPQAQLILIPRKQ